MEVKGRDSVAGLPKTIHITSQEIREALADTISAIVEAVRAALERCPPELSAAPVGVIDYWLQFPDGQGLCLVSFSTPHLDQLAEVQRLSDAIVLAAAWDLAPTP